ncbi:hypothetical protein [Novipirellula sp.]|uniref:hypothetical protein n=1 Tax=Novipirellula sp. TaxID=2795430 RepID=UPI0035634A1E
MRPLFVTVFVGFTAIVAIGVPEILQQSFAHAQVPAGGRLLKRQLLVVHRNCDVIPPADMPNRGSSTLVANTVVSGIREETFGQPKRNYWLVGSVENSSTIGWVSAGAVTTLDSRAKELQARAIYQSRLQPSDSESLTNVPTIIAIQNNPTINKAWAEIQSAIADNDALPESDRLPDPYLARAEIWASVGNDSSALQDYLTAIDLIRDSDRDLQSYSRYLDTLYSVARRLQSAPVPASGSEPDLYTAARHHYGFGCTKFFAGDYFGALNDFDNAVQLAPTKPRYWYFRSLSRRATGDLQRAQHDALIGAYFERQLNDIDRRSLSGSLFKIQGESRLWLEAYRLGSVNSSTVNTSDIRFGR